MPKQTVNSIILNLKENNLISMQASSYDKRVKTLVLTSKGEDEVKKITRSLSLSNQKIYDQLGEDKINAIEQDLNELIFVLEKNINEEVIWVV